VSWISLTTWLECQLSLADGWQSEWTPAIMPPSSSTFRAFQAAGSVTLPAHPDVAWRVVVSGRTAIDDYCEVAIVIGASPVRFMGAVQ
jgi:hypothetical protein